MTRIKICGLKDTATALYATSCGVDYIGLVFTPCRRQVIPEQAKAICNTLRQLKQRPQLVGVFVNEEADEINRLANSCELDAVQLNGEESLEYCRLINKPVIKTLHVTEGEHADEIAARTAEIVSHGFSCLLDTRVGGRYGGTGKTFNWRQATQAAARYPVIVAGGLTPANVARLISEVKPWGVDVSGGVETAGDKDKDKIKAFISAVRWADEYVEALNEDA